MMQGALDFNPLDVLAAAAALQSANENVPPRELVCDGTIEESPDEPDSDPNYNVKKVCEDFQNSELVVSGTSTGENVDINIPIVEDVASKKRVKGDARRLLYSDIYQLNNMHGKDVLRILKEKNHLANISHFIDHSYALFTPHQDLIAKITDLTKSDERASDSEESNKNCENTPQESQALPSDRCLRRLLTSEQPSDLAQGVRDDASVEQTVPEVDEHAVADENVLPSAVDVSALTSGENLDETDSNDNNISSECPDEISATGEKDTELLQPETNMVAETDGIVPSVDGSDEPFPNDLGGDLCGLGQPVAKEASDEGQMLTTECQDSVESSQQECNEPSPDNETLLSKIVGVSSEDQVTEPPSVGTVLQNGYIQLVEPSTFMPSSQNAQQTLLVVGPDGLCSSVLIENSETDDPRPEDDLPQEKDTSETEVVGQMPSLASKLPNVTKLLFAAHPSASAVMDTSCSQPILDTSSANSVCDNNESLQKIEVSTGDVDNRSPQGQEKFVSVTETLNRIMSGSDQGDKDGVLHLQISHSSLTPQAQPSFSFRGSHHRSIPQSPGKPRLLPSCSSLVPSPSKDRLTLPSDSNMKHLRIAGGVVQNVVPSDSSFWENSSEADSSLDPSNASASSSMNQGQTLTPPSAGLVPTFVPLTSLSQASPLGNLNIFSKQTIDIGQISPIGSEKSRSNMSSPSIASPLLSPRDPSLGGKRNAFMTNKDVCIGLHCSSPSESCLLHRGLCMDRPSSVSSQDNSVDGLTDCGSPAPVGGITYKIQHSIGQHADIRRNRSQLLDSESNSECDCPSGQSSRNQSPDSKKGRGVHRERISAEHDYLSVFGKPRPPDGFVRTVQGLPPERKNCQPNANLPLNSELANQLLKLKPGRPPSSNPVGRPKNSRPKNPRLGMFMKRGGLYIPTGPLVSDADKRGEHPLKDHDYCLHAFYQAMTFNTVDEGPRRPGPVPKVKVKKEKKKPKVEVSVSDSNDAESPDKRKNKKKHRKLKTEVKKKKKKMVLESPTSAETSDAEETLELTKALDNIKKEPVDFSDEGEQEVAADKDDPLYTPPIGKVPEKILRVKEKKVVPFNTRQKDEDRVKIPGTTRFQDQFIYFATKKPRRRARPILGDMSKLPEKMFTSQSEFLPGLDSSYIEARSKYLGKLVPDKNMNKSEAKPNESENETSRSEPFSSVDLPPQDHLDLPSDFMMTDIPHGRLAIGISEEESQFIHSLYTDDQEQPAGNEEFPQEMENMNFDLTNEQVREFLNTVGVEKAMKFLVGENIVEETVEAASPVPPSGDDAHEHMISSKDPVMLPTVTTDTRDLSADIVVSSMAAVTSCGDQPLSTPKDTIASIRESLEMETESIKSGTSETHMSAANTPVPKDSTSTIGGEPDVGEESQPVQAQTDLGLQDGNEETQNDSRPDQKDPLNTSDLGFTNIATDSTPHDLFDLDDDDLLNANLNLVNMNMILNFQSPDKASLNHRANDNGKMTKMRKIDFENNSSVPSSSFLPPPPSSPLIPKPMDTASIDSDISIDSTTHSSHTIESTRPGRNNPFSIGKPDMFKSGMLNRLHNIPDPTDSGVPELIFVNMFWNDLPGLLINSKEYVRLVDIHKQVLPAKPTGLLKNRCRALKLDFSNCSELQRDFLIRYAHAAASRSTLIVTKAVAETLIGYYVNPPPRSSRADLQEDNDVDVEIERLKFPSGKGKGRGKRSRMHFGKASSRLTGAVINVDREPSPPVKVTLKLKECANYSRIVMPKERLVSYSTSEESSASSDDESSDSETEETRQKRIRRILSLRRKAKTLRREIMLITGQKFSDEDLPSHKRVYRKRLPVNLKKRSGHNIAAMRSGRSSTSSSRRNSIDNSRRKTGGKVQRMALDPVEAEKRTERAIFDIDATIDEVLGNVRRQCEAEERRGKIIRSVNRTNKLLNQRPLPALYQRLVAKQTAESSDAKKPAVLQSKDIVVTKSSAEPEESVPSPKVVTDVPATESNIVEDDIEIPVTLSEKVTVLPVNQLGPNAELKLTALANEPEMMPGTAVAASSHTDDELLTPSCEKERENTTQESSVVKPERDGKLSPSEEHLVTIENFSPTSGRSKFIQPILVQISESTEGVVTINMPKTPVPKLVSAEDRGSSDRQEKSPVTIIDTESENSNENSRVGSLAPTIMNGDSHVSHVLMRKNSPRESNEQPGPLSVLHRDSVHKNGKRLSQSGRLYLQLFNDNSSKCIRCVNCEEYFTTETFLRHLHGGDDANSLLDVEAKQTLDIQSSEPSEWEQTQWQEFKAKCHKLEVETPHDSEKNGKNGNKIVKALQFEIIKQTQAEQIAHDPNVRHSSRKRKRKQFYPIEGYVMSSAQESGDTPTETEEIQEIVKQEIKKVNASSDDKNHVEKTTKVSVDSNKNQVHENGNNPVHENGKNPVHENGKMDAGGDHKDRVVENGNSSETSRDRSRVSSETIRDRSRVRRTSVQFKRDSATKVTKRTPSTPSPSLVSGQRVSSRESTSRFKRRLSDVSAPNAKRLCVEGAVQSRRGVSKSPARSTRSHPGEKPLL